MNTEPVNIYHQQAEQYRLNGEMEKALEYYQKSAEIEPLSAAIQCDLGNMYREFNLLEQAVKQYQKALKLNANLATASNNLGLIWAETGNLNDAIEYFKAAIKSDPHYINAYHNLAQTYTIKTSWADVIHYEQQALKLQPNHPTGQFLLGYALAAKKDYQQAIVHYQIAIKLQPNHYEAYQALGRALLAFHRWEEADQIFNFALRQKRGIPWNEQTPVFSQNNPYGLYQNQLSRFEIRKIQHDHDQITYLLQHNYLKSYQQKLREWQQLYGQILAQVQQGNDQISPSQLQHLNHFWGKNIYIHPLPIQNQSVLNPIDRQVIEDKYKDSEIGFVSFDNFLKPDILNLLYEFALSSTIWHDYLRSDTYLAAYGRDGLSQPLLYQIAEELRANLPAIFRDLPVLKLWIFKNNQFPIGVRTHADCAAINIVFWITPDEANLDPESGGLVLYDVEAPEHMSDDEVNQFCTDQTKLHEFLQQNMTAKHKITYRQNRVTIFNSKLYHETDQLNFKPGYRHRRINLNLVFGHRGE